MLSRLSIKNYALIDALDITFHRGLNILTGETGAGKSIIMGGLSLILGQRVESRYFFNQNKKCVIEGHFEISGYNLDVFFAAHDLDYEQETIIRREISADGKSRAFINDTPVTLQVLKVLAEQLIDVHSQHATLQLNTEDFQLFTLDNVAQNQQLLERYRATYRQYLTAVERLDVLKKRAKEAGEQADYHQFLYDELVSANLEVDEQVQLEAEQQQLEHAEEIKRNLLGVVYALHEQDPNVVGLLREAAQQLQQAERYLPSLAEQLGRLQSSLIELKDLAEEISRAEQGTLIDEARLQEVSDRLSLLYTLQQKHRVDSVDELITKRDALQEKLDGLSSDEEAIEQLSAEVQRLHAETQALAVQLSERRQAAVPVIEDEVVRLLTLMEMPYSQLRIQLWQGEEGAFRASGTDHVSFLFTANKGQQPQPVGKVASGGELSRLMLAIKSLIAKTSALPTVIFDEIDTGISGEVALKVADIMEQLAEHMQVLAITHLPQIAAKGETHFKVYKVDSEEKTVTNIVQLNAEERITEIAQLLSGAKPGEAAMQHAAELLESRKTVAAWKGPTEQ